MAKIITLKAAALQFAILVSVIIAILLASFLALTQAHRFFDLQSEMLLETIDQTKVGIDYSLNPKNMLIDSIAIENDGMSTTVKKATWGGFLKISSKSHKKTKSFSQMALTGAIIGKEPFALLVSEPLLPLVLVGNTRIEGDALVSSRGIKAGVISGKYFNGSQLVYGDIKARSGPLPGLDKEWIETNKALLKTSVFPNAQLFEIQKEQKNSFYDSVRLYYANGPMLIEQSFIGNIIIKSETEIVVSPLAKLTDVLLIAPKITIQQDFTGNVHLLASKQIKLEENVILQYPSSITVLDETEDFNTPILKGDEPIYLSEHSQTMGNIIYLTLKEMAENRSNTSVTLQKESTVRGQIYCEGNLEVLGTVEGSIYTERFIFNGFGSRYVNHLYDATIDANNLPKGFCGLPLEAKEKGMVQWLY